MRRCRWECLRDVELLYMEGSDMYKSKSQPGLEVQQMGLITWCVIATAAFWLGSSQPYGWGSFSGF